MNSLKQKMTMKTKNMFWAALSMTATLLMTACSSDNDMTETPVAPSTSKTIPYTVTVSDDAATTRANVGDDNRTLSFATGDKLYITGTNIQGVLNLQAGDENKTTGATFSGELTYTGDGSPADNLTLTATLVSAQMTQGTHFSVDADGAVTVNYPNTAYCSTIGDAVQQYSRLTGTCQYSQRAFTLAQQTAFLNFVITFDDGTASGTALSAVFSNNSSSVCTANVTTEAESEEVVAKFVLPVASGTVLNNATVKMGNKEALAITNATLTGKVYNVKKTQDPHNIMITNATSSDQGKLICTDGHIHAYGEDGTCPKERVAKIIYVNSSSGNATDYYVLALALEDVSSNNLSWDNTGENNDGKTAREWCYALNTSKAVTNATWMLPEKDQWNAMISAAGGYSALRDGFSSVGGTNLKQKHYWSSTEIDYWDGGTHYGWVSAEVYNFSAGSWRTNGGGKGLSGGSYVRACLAYYNKEFTMAANATSSDQGKLICTDGHIHPYNEDGYCPKERVANIILVGSGTEYTHGLALALEDVSSNKLTWNNTGENNNGKTAAEWCSAWNTSKAVTNASWMLPSENQWRSMIDAVGGYTELLDTSTSVGGTNMVYFVSTYYWSSTEVHVGTGGYSMICLSFTPNLDSEKRWREDKPDRTNYVRACLAF